MISLEKRTEQVKILLEKRNITKAPIVRVGLAIDISGSTRNLYEDGVIQEVVDRLLAIACKFDDNGEMDMWSFTNDFNRLPSASAAEYGAYVQKNILQNRNVSKWGGTSYFPVMENIVNAYFPKGMLGGMFSKKKPETPAMVLFITDGETNDVPQTAKLLRESQNKNIYWAFVGVGPPRHFQFIKEMADELPNVGLVNMSTLAMPDADLYDQMITEELCTWVKKQ